ncbi:MAG TPA: outer membrane beta-barrel protein [Arenicellales bacterium]|nr:outer membrane beta-barrel protein [Arenicellales bacterium]
MNMRAALIAVALMTMPAAGAMAAGPIDGEAGLNWWANDFDADLGGGDVDAGAVGGHLQLWWNETWGLKGALYRSDLADSGDADDVDYLSIDLKRRIISVTENNYLAAGVGYQQLDLRGGKTEGLRLLAEGRVGLVGAIWLYGQSAWMPVFDDTSAREDQDAFELEAGVGFSPLPFIKLSAGWRKFSLDFTDTAADTDRSNSASGPVFEAGVKW